MNKLKEYYLNKWADDLTQLSVRTSVTPVGLNGKVFHCNTSDMVYVALLFMEAMGASTKNVASVESMIKRRSDEEAPYLGVLNGKLGIYKGDEVVKQDGYQVLSFPNRMDNLSDLIHERLGDAIPERCRWVSCDTPELAILLGRVLHERGKTWSSGTKYIDTSMYFGSGNLDCGQSYDTDNGFYGAPSNGEGTTAFTSLLFYTKIDLTYLGETLKLEDMRLNSIYVINKPMPGSFSDVKQRVIFKFINRDLNRSQIMIGNNGQALYNRRALSGYQSYIIGEATSEEKRIFRIANRGLQSALREERVALHNERMRLRANTIRLRNLSKLRVHNENVKTQLFSYTMHTYLHKIAETNKIARTLCKLNRLGYEEGVLRNITISKSTEEMTYTLPNKETVMTPNNRWEKKGRQSGKYGKILRKVLVEQVPKFKIVDQDLEKLVNHLKACASNGDFSIVKGADIQKWYDGGMYANDDSTGTLGCSCMRHNPEYMELYAKNPDVCSMVILVKEGVLHGRALLWNGKYMDRIYGSDSTITAFKAYAVKKGYHSKSAQNSDNYDRWIDPTTGDEYTKTFTISLNTDCEYYPYADTFYFIDVDGNSISNDSSHGCAQLRSTDGEIYDDERVWDEYDGRYISEDDAVYMEYREEYTHRNNTDYCAITSEYYLDDDIVSLSNGDRAWRDCEDIIFCEDDDVYAHIDDTFSCEHDDMIYCSDLNNSEYLDELGITVHEDNVEEAYKSAGYTYDEDEMEWVLLTEKTKA